MTHDIEPERHRRNRYIASRRLKTLHCVSGVLDMRQINDGPQPPSNEAEIHHIEDPVSDVSLSETQQGGCINRTAVIDTTKILRDDSLVLVPTIYARMVTELGPILVPCSVPSHLYYC